MVQAQSATHTVGSLRITCHQDHLSRGLAIVSRAVGGRTTLPVLNNVLLASDGDRLKLSATNSRSASLRGCPAQWRPKGSSPSRRASSPTSSIRCPPARAWSWTEPLAATACTLGAGEEISLDLSGPLSPAQIRGVGLPDFQHVLMPLVSMP